MTDFLVGLITIAIGLVGCFYGYVIFRVMLPILGGVLGYIIGVHLVDNRLLGFILGLAIAAVLALLAYFVWGALVAISGALLGFGIGFLLGAALNLPNWVNVILGIVVGAVLGGLYFVFKDMLVMVNTAFSGSGGVLYGVSLLAPSLLGFLHDRNNIISVLLWLALGAVGFLVQYRLFAERQLYQEAGSFSATRPVL